MISYASACLSWNNVLLSYWKGAICVTNCWSIGHHFCLSHLLLYSYALKCDKGLHLPYLTFFCYRVVMGVIRRVCRTRCAVTTATWQFSWRNTNSHTRATPSFWSCAFTPTVNIRAIEIAIYIIIDLSKLSKSLQLLPKNIFRHLHHKFKYCTCKWL